jgi:hypothetical protein
MKTIPFATTITLTAEERSVLEALDRSTKTEVRMRDRARMVLLAAGGTATREIGGLVAAPLQNSPDLPTGKSPGGLT